ncbi:hypothetical protein EVC28_072 [Rhizobium phage RHph_I1_23]|nr:hypothetical protein EVC28_072 [Rhizobium phage RHph_I1_23]
MTRKLIILTIWIALAIALATPFLILASCQSRYEPPGDGLWRAL